MGSDYSGSMPLPAYQIRFGLPHHVAAYIEVAPEAVLWRRFLAEASPDGGQSGPCAV